MTSMAETKPLLRVRNLRTTFRSHKQLVKAVRGFNIEVAPGEIVAVVGESGSGKSVAMKSIMGLLPPMPTSRPTCSSTTGATCWP